MKLVGAFSSEEDEVTFVWIRGLPDEPRREPLKAAFCEGDLWDRWPAPTP